jgi:uncharacterized protein (DUF4415 family)
MNVKRTTKPSNRSRANQTRTDWKRFDALSDADIRKAVRSDPDAAPIANAAWFRKAKIVLPKPKKAVSIRLDRDVMDWFQRDGRGYQTRINAVLRAYVDAHR